jgi:hypothetical protein
MANGGDDGMDNYFAFTSFGDEFEAGIHGVE